MTHTKNQIDFETQHRLETFTWNITIAKVYYFDSPSSTYVPYLPLVFLIKYKVRVKSLSSCSLLIVFSFRIKTMWPFSISSILSSILAPSPRVLLEYLKYAWTIEVFFSLAWPYPDPMLTFWCLALFRKYLRERCNSVMLLQCQQHAIGWDEMGTQRGRPRWINVSSMTVFGIILAGFFIITQEEEDLGVQCTCPHGDSWRVCEVEAQREVDTWNNKPLSQ